MEWIVAVVEGEEEGTEDRVLELACLVVDSDRIHMVDMEADHKMEETDRLGCSDQLQDTKWLSGGTPMVCKSLMVD